MEVTSVVRFSLMMVKWGFYQLLYRPQVETGLKQVCYEQTVILKQGAPF